jgi:hypothetical protein
MGRKPILRQGQGGKHPARPKAHHHRALTFLLAKIGRRLAGWVPSHVGRGLDVRIFFELVQQGGFGLRVGQRQIHDVDRQQVRLAGVKAAFEDVECGDVGCADAQCLGCELAQRINGVRRGQPVLVGLRRRIGGAAHVDRQGRQGEFEF